MESRSQSDSDAGGGGSVGHAASPAGLLRVLRDAGRPQAPDGPPNPGSTAGQQQPSSSAPAPPVLSLDQIRATRNSNEYTEGPTVAPRSPATQPGQQHKSSLVISPPGATEPQHGETRDERPNNLRNQRNLLPPSQHGTIHPAAAREGVSRSSSAEDSWSGSVRTSTGSASSAQRLLGGERIIRTQPKHVELKPDELKPLNEAAPAAAVARAPGLGEGDGGPSDRHAYRCEDCGRCRCAECVRPRALPSCWLCGRRCVCSAQSAVEYGTCACCVKGLFYHCSSDDEDTCADKPFSCAQSHCCVRWTVVSLLSFCLPCLLCYLPAKGCLAACQSCYDRATRPGCRCKNTNVVHCKSVDKPT